MLIQFQPKVHFCIKRSKSLLSLCHFVIIAWFKAASKWEESQACLNYPELTEQREESKFTWTIPSRDGRRQMVNVSSFAEGKAMKWQGQSYAMAHSKLWNEAVKDHQWEIRRIQMWKKEG